MAEDCCALLAALMAEPDVKLRELDVVSRIRSKSPCLANKVRTSRE